MEATWRVSDEISLLADRLSNCFRANELAGDNTRLALMFSVGQCLLPKARSKSQPGPAWILPFSSFWYKNKLELYASGLLANSLSRKYLAKDSVSMMASRV